MNFITVLMNPIKHLTLYLTPQYILMLPFVRYCRSVFTNPLIAYKNHSHVCIIHAARVSQEVT